MGDKNRQHPSTDHRNPNSSLFNGTKNTMKTFGIICNEIHSTVLCFNYSSMPKLNFSKEMQNILNLISVAKIF